jgi:glycosyltransferase involved in cell wall biosynthesis
MSRRLSVLFIQATEAAGYPPLINAAKLFSRAGWRPIFLSAPVAGRTMALPDIAGMELEEIAARPSYIMGKPAYAEYCRRSVTLAFRLRPDVVYCSDPMGALPGLMAAAVSGSKLVYHEHDSPNRQTDLSLPIRISRCTAARRADLIVLPNAARAAHMCAELAADAARVRIVWNTPLRSEVIDTATDWSSQQVWLYYHGSITPDRLPETVFKAAASFQGRVKIEIAGYETASGAGYVNRMIGAYGDAANGGLVRSLGQIPQRSDLLRRAAQAHLGLALMPPESTDINMRHMAGASNKAFDYMAAGLPIVVSELPDWNEMFVRPGHAVAAAPEDVESLKAAIRSLIDAPEMAASMVRRNREKILTEWNYETQFAPVLEALSV